MIWFLAEAFRGIRARPGFALVLVLVSAGLTGTALWYANVSRSAVGARASAVESDGWYVVTFTDVAGDRMTSGELASLCALDSVEWAAGVLPAEDFASVGVDRPVTLRGLRGCGLHRIGVPVDPSGVHGPVGLVGQFPLGAVPGELAMSVDGSVGVVTVVQYDGLPVDLLGGRSTEGYVVLPARSANEGDDVLSIRVGACSLDDAMELARVGPRVMRGSAAVGLRVQPTGDQFEARRTYLTGLDRRSALVVVAIVGAAAVLSAVMLVIASRLRASEYARRRTLGCRRLPLVAQVMVEAMATTALGAVAGAAAFRAAELVGVEVVLPGGLFVAVPAVLIAATGLCSVPVAVWVGRRDPILVLRVP